MTLMELQPGADFSTYIMNGVATLVLAFGAWLAKRAFNLLSDAHKKLDHIDECMDGVKAASEADRRSIQMYHDQAEERDKEIAELKRQYAGLEGWAKGRFGLSIDAEITQVPPQ